jgi:4-hydroxy-4-methyl-2-oxoglutarate aldolase
MNHNADQLSETARGELMELGSATLGESGAVALSPRIKAMWKGARCAGPVMTASCAAGDNLALHAAVAAAQSGAAQSGAVQPGAVLAVSFAGESVRGYWGEVLTTAAEAAGLAALVIDGGVRDIDAIERHGFPVFASQVALRGAAKAGPGAVQVPVVLGDALVRPGDWLVGDADGVVVIGQENLAACRAAALARAEKEAGFFTRLRDGATTVGLLSLDVSSIAGA